MNFDGLLGLALTGWAMMDMLFRFQGRLTRVQHLVLSSCVSLVGGLLIVGILLTMRHLQGGNAVIPGTWVLAATPLALPFFWVSFSLQAARIRDIGFDPRVVLLALFAINVTCLIITVLIADGALSNLIYGFGRVTNAAYGSALLFLPSDYRFQASGTVPVDPTPIMTEANHALRPVTVGRDAPVFGKRKSK